MLKVDPWARRKGGSSRASSSRAQQAFLSPADTAITPSRAIHHPLLTQVPAPGHGLGRPPSQQKWRDWGLPSGRSGAAETIARPEKLHQGDMAGGSGIGVDSDLGREEKYGGGVSQEP